MLTAASRDPAAPPKLVPLRPKGACSAYIFFSLDMRPKLKEDGDSIPDLARKIGDAWGKLSDKEKVPYQKKADADLARYQKEMENYKPPEE